MKAVDIRKMSDEEQRTNVNNLKEEFAKLSFQHRIRPLENTSRLSQIKKDIARILTVQGQNQ